MPQVKDLGAAGGSRSVVHRACTGDLQGTSRFTAENHHGTKVMFRNSTIKPLTRCSRCQRSLVLYSSKEAANQKEVLEVKTLGSERSRARKDLTPLGSMDTGS